VRKWEASQGSAVSLAALFEDSVPNVPRAQGRRKGLLGLSDQPGLVQDTVSDGLLHCLDWPALEQCFDPVPVHNFARTATMELV